MLRKTLCLFVCTPFLITSYAQAGLYVGKGFGSDFVSFKQTSHITKPGSFEAIDTTRQAGIGVFGTLYIGASKIIHKQYIAALELNGNLSSSSFQRSNDEYVHQNFSNSSYKINNTFGVSILPGYQFTPDTLFYGRLGYSNGHFISRSSDPSLENMSQCMDGFRYGVGLTRSITKHTDFRFDYSLTNYRNVQFITVDLLSNTTKHTKVTPFQQLVELSLIYRFTDSDTILEK